MCAAHERLSWPPLPAPAVFPFGVSWYPEQWPESDWDADLRQMSRAHITFVRIAEFSWAILEPTEGTCNFQWLDRAIAAAAIRGIKVVLGTPTAAPPSWLTTRYPQVLAVNADGTRAHHGWRRQFSGGSALYRRLAAGIAARMAERYGHDPRVLGFQIDNEYGRETFDEETRGRFQDWMQARYGTLTAFNAAYLNVYWSMRYESWSQIKPPAKDDQPQLYVDWLRFVSDMWRDYQRAQLEAMRPFVSADKIITTNYVAKYDEFDFSVPAQDLNRVSWDWYFDEPRLVPADGALQHDLYRGFLGSNPWVMETAAGHQTGSGPVYMQPRGQTRAMLWQAVGHGADGYAFWVWRAPLNGTETAHGALVDAAGRPKPIFDEIALAGSEIGRAWPSLRGTALAANVAMLYDYSSRWNIERKPGEPRYDVWKNAVRFRRALSPISTGVDVLLESRKLSAYRLVVASDMSLMSESVAQALVEYVRGGGHLVLEARSGEKHEDGTVWRPGQLGPLESMLGARIDLSVALDGTARVAGSLGSGTAMIWAARASPIAGDLEVLLRYGSVDGWFDGMPAVVSRRVGAGRITYIGAWLDDELLGKVMAWTAERAEVHASWRAIPSGVEVDERRGEGRTVYVIVNFAAEPRSVSLPHPMHNLLGAGTVPTVTLSPLDVAVMLESTR